MQGSQPRADHKPIKDTSSEVRRLGRRSGQVVFVPARERLVRLLIKTRSKEPGDTPRESDAVLDFPEKDRIALAAVVIGHVKGIQAEKMKSFSSGPLDDTVNVAMVTSTWGLGDGHM